LPITWREKEAAQQGGLSWRKERHSDPEDRSKGNESTSDDRHTWSRSSRSGAEIWRKRRKPDHCETNALVLYARERRRKTRAGDASQPGFKPFRAIEPLRRCLRRCHRIPMPSGLLCRAWRYVWLGC